MKVLILSCNTGEGHNSSAGAVAQKFHNKGIECDTVDALRFISPAVSEMMAQGHRFVYRRLPGLFDWGYRFSEKHDFFYRKGAPLYAFLSLGAKKLADYINENGYDTVICAHVFTGVMMTEAKPLCSRNILTSFLTTDYTCSPITEQSCLDMYFIPDNRVADQFTARGVDRDRLIPTGIPVREDFHRMTAMANAKNAEGISPEHTHLVMMCGSMGCGPMAAIVRMMAEKLSESMEMTVVCGNNKRLYEKLRTKYTDHPQIHIRGYVTDISRLMDAADVYLTKPGGISVTEAGVKRVPMVLVNAVGGCEQYNYDFFIGNGAAKTGRTVEELTDCCIELLLHPETGESMGKICGESIACHGAEEIVTHLVSAYENISRHLAFRMRNAGQTIQEEFAV